MKKTKLKPWMRYALVFAALLALNAGLRRISPGDEWKDGNLLVNLVATALLTTGFAAADRLWRRNKPYRDKLKQLLHNNEQ